MIEKKVNIENFIGVYDNYISEDECKNAIAFFEGRDKLKHTLNRLNSEDTSILNKQDQQYFAHGNNIEAWWEELKPLMINFDMAWKHYSRNVGADTYSCDFHYTSLKIQKTYKTEGYHVWHIEHGAGFENMARAFVFSVYLNDVEEGGETEFLHFSKRVKPKTGRIVIWPAAFPYLHRGNPPLSGEKYILTSWIMLRGL